MHLEVPNGVCELKANFHVQENGTKYKMAPVKGKNRWRLKREPGSCVGP